VRHNEELTNEELAPACRFSMPPIYDDPHVKANILLQCYVARKALPVADYGADTRSLLGQTIRILQAMVDVAADGGWLDTTLRVMSLVQTLKQARWWDECPLTTLPGVTSSVAAQLRRQSIKVQAPQQQQQQQQQRVPVSLPALLHASNANVDAVLCRVKLSELKRRAVQDALRQLPMVAVEHRLRVDDDDDDDANDDGAAGSGSVLRVAPDTEVNVCIDIDVVVIS
jgi:hypothetical protein